MNALLLVHTPFWLAVPTICPLLLISLADAALQPVG